MRRTVLHMTLAEFLLARIAEDEATAQCRQVENIPEDCSGPGRVLAECEAKRQIIALAQQWNGDPNDYGQLQTVLAYLALPYADRPDYDEAWRP